MGFDIADYPYGWMDSEGTPKEVRDKANKEMEENHNKYRGKNANSKNEQSHK
jgi:hypothetical protein